MAKILLVEDDTNLSEIYQARMEAEGYQVVAASDGESALALAAKEKPDLIISDVMMPKISGFEMLDILRNTDGLKNTPVIMLTALGQADDKDRADSLGADRYLVKSQVTLEDIVNAAHSLLEGESVPQLTQVQEPVTVAAVPIAIAQQPSDGVVAPSDPAPVGPLTPSVATPTPIIPLTVAPVVADGIASTQPVQPSPSVPVIDPPTTITDPPLDTDPPAVKDAPATENFTQAGNNPALDLTIIAADNTTRPIATPVIASLPPAQTTAQENASVNDKIAGFAHRPVAPVQVPQPTGSMTRNQAPTTPTKPTIETTVESIVAQPVPQPAQPLSPEPTPPTAASIDQNVVTKAIDQLLTLQSAPQQAVPPSEHGRVLSSTPTTLDKPAQDDRPLKKVISPIARPAEATLDELLAKEEALEMAADAASRQLYDPNAQSFDTLAAAEQFSEAAMPEAAIPEAAIPGQEPADSKKPPFDPNSISL